MVTLKGMGELWRQAEDFYFAMVTLEGMGGDEGLQKWMKCQDQRPSLRASPIGLKYCFETKPSCLAAASSISRESSFLCCSLNNHTMKQAFLEAIKGKAPKSVITDGDQAMKIVKTILEELEEFAATLYTREVFVLFREVLLLASNVRVVSSKKTSTCTLFEVIMYCQGRSWNVSWDEMDDEFRCSCLNMESFGIPYIHIVGVLVRLNMVVIPDAAYMSMHVAMLNDYRELVKLSCSYFEDYFDVKTKIANEREALREKIWKRLATTVEGGGDDAEGGTDVSNAAESVARLAITLVDASTGMVTIPHMN
ncbi:hypothetical protein Ahy_A02g007952 [Arachis hypogaea]|uniref:Protein FAR1-RELATED SEQUENCE n=1 Tax=Arachis hypogaea TaxID=3818 RepID=A0A445EDI7_ARAHY|nr:hypothetical protein Ahy_A02g007952 [Arachis hypogaea]